MNIVRRSGTSTVRAADGRLENMAERPCRQSNEGDIVDQKSQGNCEARSEAEHSLDGSQTNQPCAEGIRATEHNLSSVQNCESSHYRPEPQQRSQVEGDSNR
jgi:hypothetical protein